MKIDLALRELHRSEQGLSRELSTLADRHPTDHEIFHIARDIAVWSDENVVLLADAGRRYGLDLSHQPRTEAVTARVLSTAAGLLRRRSEPSLLLLADLRHLHRTAVGVSLDWELLAQGAQAVTDPDLVELCAACHPQTLRQAKWANAMLKVLAPQALAS
ncbi:hypothetical protein [Rhodococcus triatomae]|nr:hypothetical protein G419_04028 [Rhodococcus triatomae BKS 15-14]